MIMFEVEKIGVFLHLACLEGLDFKALNHLSLKFCTTNVELKKFMLGKLN